MKIAIAMVQVPFITGGAELHAKMLKDELVKRGHQAEIVTIPFKWYPWEQLVNCMMMGRLMDLTEVNGEKIDRVIALKFPAYYVKHDNKVLWLEHQHRQAYDLWNTEYGDLQNLPNGKQVRDFIRICDRKYIHEAKKVFTIAGNTTKRLMDYCKIPSTVLYHPPLNYEKLHGGEFGDYVFYPSRIDSIKRQRLLVEAASYLKTDAKVVLAGGGSEAELRHLRNLIRKHHLETRVKLAGFISEEEKINYYSNCFLVYFGAYDEDYGYITLEAFFSEKPVIIHEDSGGPLEFVEDRENGFVVRTDPRMIAEKVDYLYEHRDEAKRMGRKGRQSMDEKNLNWDYVIDQLLSD